MLTTVLVVVHFIVAALIIAMVLMQQGKGADMGASFGGGGGNTVLGAAGGMSVFARGTAILATIFFVTSFALALSARNSAVDGLQEDIPFLETVPPSETIIDEVPVAPAEPVNAFEFGDIPSAPSGDQVESAPAGDIPQAPQ